MLVSSRVLWVCTVPPFTAVSGYAVVKTTPTGLVIYEWFSLTLRLPLKEQGKVWQARPAQDEEIATTPKTNSGRDVGPTLMSRSRLPMALHGVFMLSTID